MAARFLAVLAGVLLTTTAAAAAGVDPGDYGQLKWRSIGPFRGGRVLAVEGDPRDARHVYFGSVNGGVWETRDAGRTWAPIFDDAPVASIGAIAIAPSRPDTLYVGTGEADMRSDIAQGVGMFKSTDAGRTWARIGLAETQTISRILVDPRDPDVVLAASLGHPYGPNAERGVFRSADGGATWTRTLFHDADTGAIDMAFAPDNPDVVYAALWQTRRPPWSVYPPSSGPGGGVYKSLDGGRTWSKVGGGLPDKVGRVGLATSPASPHRVYALVDATDGAGGLWRSDDDGATFTQVSKDKRIWNRGWYFGGITANPVVADDVYVSNTIILHSTDGGRTFLPMKGDPTGDDYHVMWIDPKNPDRRVLGVDQGALVTLNGGATWSSWLNQPTGQFYHVVTDSRFPYRVYGSQQDSGAAGVPSRTEGVNGISMPEFHEITAGGESDNIAPDPDDPDIVYGGRVDRLDLRTHQTRSIDPTLAFPGRYRGEWTQPLVFGPRDHALYFANQRIFRTPDGGEHWTPISPDLTREDPGAPPNLDQPTIEDEEHIGPRRGVVYAIGPSPVSDGLIWAGTDDGLVWKSADGGARWEDVTPKGRGMPFAAAAKGSKTAPLLPWSKIGVIEPSHFDAAVAYVAVDRHRLDDFHPYALRTRDGGRTWTAISRGLDEGGSLNAVNVVREDPKRRGLLYAGTERGAFVSFDDGEHWAPLQAGLPRTSIRDITVHDDDLVVATHGRGFYVMDDVAPLRDLADHPRTEAPRLFTPATTVRFRPSGFVGTPMPRDEPMAQNPPAGAYIDYVLPTGRHAGRGGVLNRLLPRRGKGNAAPAAASSPPTVTITIKDAAGRLVRRLSSADPTVHIDPATIGYAPEWAMAPLPPSAAPGPHRYVWDLHYAAPPELDPDPDAGDFTPTGVWAPPGRYTVELTAGGRTLSQPLTVVPDPRVKASPADYARQFELARAIEADRVKVRQALDAAKKAHADLAARIAREADPARKSALQAEDARLMDLADLPPIDPRNSMPPAPHSTTALSDISTALDKLAQAADGADGRPTADVETGFRQADAAATETLRAWEALKR